MSKKKRKSSPPDFHAELERIAIEAAAVEAEECGTSAAAAAAAAEAEALEYALRWYAADASYTPAQQQIAAASYAAGVRVGYVMAAMKSHTARKRGAAASGGKRAVGKSRLYADIQAFVAAATGTDAERRTAAANHFGKSEATIWRAMNAQ